MNTFKVWGIIITISWIALSVWAFVDSKVTFSHYTVAIMCILNAAFMFVNGVLGR